MCVCFVVVDCAAVAAIIRGANSRVYSSGVLHYYVHALKIGLMPKTSKASHHIYMAYQLSLGFRFFSSLLAFFRFEFLSNCAVNTQRNRNHKQ